MNDLQFEWDDHKDSLNRTKHGVSFEEARSVFFDPHALVIDDPDHSVKEQRFVILGYSMALRLLVVVHCFRSEGATIRIVSARKATKHESRTYHGGKPHGRHG